MSSTVAFTAANPHTHRLPQYSTLNHESEAASSLHLLPAVNLFQNGLPTPPASKTMSAASVSHHRPTFSSHQHYSTTSNCPPFVPPVQDIASTTSHQHYGHTDLASAARSAVSGADSKKQQRIATHLQIPESIKSSKGSLAELAAEMTCLFWFESSETVNYAESLPLYAPTDRGMNPDATPTIGFRKWVTTILSVTQVSREVVILALMFIHRLKKFNPGVSGKRGSEFRLLTIAFMLGNKFLDDNTYTNKTWAEVSGITVSEIHIMEVEFLSNMRYELYASKEDWHEWKAKLGRLSSFYDKALRFTTPVAATSPITPITQLTPHKLPSPSTGSRHSVHWPYLPNPFTTIPQLPHSPARSQMSDHLLSRKRSLDASYDLPVAKRAQYGNPMHTLSPAILTPMSIMTPDSASTSSSYESTRFPQLPPPNLNNNCYNSSLQLAPLTMSQPRAISHVYNNNNNNNYSQASTPASAGRLGQTLMPVPILGHALPYSRPPSHMGSTHTSPTNYHGTATPTKLSPTHYLLNRSSPYRPVRNVNTLLHPPPSAMMQAPVRSIDYQQMAYQPLSKHNSQLHTGPMPLLQPDAWQSHVSTPIESSHRLY